MESRHITILGLVLFGANLVTGNIRYLPFKTQEWRENFYADGVRLDDNVQGGMSTVYRARDGSWLLKTASGKEERSCAKKEIGFLETLKGEPRIVQIKESAVLLDGVGMVMEYCSGGDLYDFCKRCSEEQKRSFIVQMFEALDVVHKNKIIHRDIKLQNFVVNREDDLKLIDFGYAVEAERQFITSTYVGTVGYIAPEVKDSHYEDAYRPYEYSAESDVWATGVAIWEMVYQQDFINTVLKTLVGTYGGPQDSNLMSTSDYRKLMESLKAEMETDKYYLLKELRKCDRGLSDSLSRELGLLFRGIFVKREDRMSAGELGLLLKKYQENQENLRVARRIARLTNEVATAAYKSCVGSVGLQIAPKPYDIEEEKFQPTEKGVKDVPSDI